MRLAIMQPYFFPYIGYWQLINAVDKFVVYDSIQFTKKSWIHRNRFLQNGKDVFFSLYLKKDSDYLNINQRFLSESNKSNIEKILRQLENSYRKAPNFNDVMPLLIDCFWYHEDNIFPYILHSINQVTKYLDIKTPILTSSSLEYDNTLKAQEKVLDICRVFDTSTYINPIGGVKLYNKQAFDKKGITLSFMKMDDIQYTQFKGEFVSSLSIIDVMMFNQVDEIKKLLKNFTLL